MSELREKRPHGAGWREVPMPQALRDGIGGPHHSAWQHGVACVISSLGDLDLPGTDGVKGPTWFVSITRLGERPEKTDVRRVLRAFDMRGADEDNHYPGKSRGWFMPVDPRYRKACECKTTEAVIVEPDGFTWTNPHEGSCRGCEHGRIYGVPCPVHPRKMSPAAARGLLGAVALIAAGGRRG